jgi:hypothetical protein
MNYSLWDFGNWLPKWDLWVIMAGSGANNLF